MVRSGLTRPRILRRDHIIALVRVLFQDPCPLEFISSLLQLMRSRVQVCSIDSVVVCIWGWGFSM